MKKSIILLIFLLFPTVYASSFTGNFYDYGNDTGTDGLYNYLTIQAGVSITSSALDYIIYGILKDSQNNTLEYDRCYNVISTGIKNFTLNFNGLELYRNKVDGPYTLSYVELSSIPNCTGLEPPTFIQSLENAHTTKAYNYTQFQKGQAAIHCNNSPCIAPPALIRSRDNLDTPEPNASNTLDGCEDGSSGLYLQSESIESMNITSLNHTFFKTGDTVFVGIKVYCDYTSDKLNFVYSNNAQDINWIVKDTKQCPSTGNRTLSTTFNLGTNVGQHSIRGIFTFNLNPLTVCGQDDVQYQWADTDDVVISVKECRINSDCPIKDCDYLDGCYSGTYRNYNDKQICLPDFHCDQSACTQYTAIITDSDGDGYDTQCDNDCNDLNQSINPGQIEICNNLVDDNCDGNIDAADPFCQGKYPLNLNPGWNLISLPKIANTNVSEIIKPFNADRIAALKQGKWYSYDKFALANSNLKTLTEADGFWIRMNNNQTVLVDNNPPAVTSFSLKQGWNLIGYPSIEEKNASFLFQSVLSDVELIYIYDGKFSSFNPLNPQDILIKPGAGIFVKTNKDINWYFDSSYKRGTFTYNLEVHADWNLISIPVITNSSVSQLFGNKTLYYLNNSQWYQLKNADKLKADKAYWLDIRPNTIPIQGSIITELNYTISQGWNLINYPLTRDSSADAFFQDVSSNIDFVASYNGTWVTYNPTKPSNTLTTLKHGKGIFIKAKSSAQWRFDGNELVTT